MFALFRLSALVALVFSAIAALSLLRGVPTTSEKNFMSSQPVATTFKPYAATVRQAWVARYNGPGNLDDVARPIAVDRSGNVYITGYSEDPTNGLDYLTIKYDSAGQQQWVKRYDGPAHDWDMPEAIAVDLSGNVYVTGESVGGAGYFGFATIKYNSAGQRQWVARYNGEPAANDFAFAIAVDSVGNVYVTGESFSSAIDAVMVTVKYNSVGEQQWVARNDQPGIGAGHAIAIGVAGSVYVTGFNNGAGTKEDYVTIAYDSAGQQQWIARYDGPGQDADIAEAIALDQLGNVFVTGLSTGSAGDYDYATIKYDSAGKQQWVARYNGPGNDWDSAVDIAVDQSGNVVVTGESIGTALPDYDYATIKYDSDGRTQWIARYNGLAAGDDEATALALDGAGNVYVTGASTNPDDGSYDYVTIKYDPAGTEQWVLRYKGPENSYDIARGIAVDRSDNVYVTGNSVGLGTGSDYATIKYGQDATATPPARVTPSPRAKPTPYHRPTPSLSPTP